MSSAASSVQDDSCESPAQPKSNSVLFLRFEIRLKEMRGCCTLGAGAVEVEATGATAGTVCMTVEERGEREASELAKRLADCVFGETVGEAQSMLLNRGCRGSTVVERLAEWSDDALGRDEARGNEWSAMLFGPKRGFQVRAFVVSRLMKRQSLEGCLTRKQAG